MAIGFAANAFIKASEGQSAVIAAGYRSRSKIKDLSTGVERDYSLKKDLAHEEILLPAGADIRFKDRAYLWNFIQAHELKKRKDAQLAFDMVLALPNDAGVTDEMRAEMARRFMLEHVVSRGFIADICLHHPHTEAKEKKERNPHAHVMITMRKLNGSVLDSKKPRADFLHRYCPDDVLGKKPWPRMWTEFQNNYFLEKGLPIRVDPKNIYTQVTTKRGRNPSAIEENELRKSEAKDKVFNSPESIISHLSNSQERGFFYEKEIQCVLRKLFDDPAEIDSIYERVKSSETLIFMGADEGGEEVFVSREFHELSQSYDALVDHLRKGKHQKVAQNHIKNSVKNSTITEEQEKAVRHIVNGKRLSIVEGFAGTGKSYMMKVANEAWKSQGLNVLGVALAGKAAQELEDASGIESRTLFSLIKGLGNGHIKLSQKDVVVLDEAGMVGMKLMHELLFHVGRSGAKIVMIGDTNQLQPIGMGAPFKSAIQRSGCIEMSDIKRQKEGWQRQASLDFATGRISEGLTAYSESGFVFQGSKQTIYSSFTVDYIERYKESVGSVIGWAYTRKEVSELNSVIRANLVEQGLIEKGEKVTVSLRGESGNIEGTIISIAPGDMVIFQKNDKGLGVKNGRIAVVQSFSKGAMAVKFLGSREVKNIDTNKFNSFSHGYVTTVHKSQGATADHSVVLANKLWNKYLTYVAMTRHRKSVKLHTELSFSDLVRTCKRAPVKDSLSDFPLTFGLNSGFSEENLRPGFVRRAKTILFDAAKPVIELFGLGKTISEAKEAQAVTDTERAGKIRALLCKEAESLKSGSVLAGRKACINSGRLVQELSLVSKLSDSEIRISSGYKRKERFADDLLENSISIQGTWAQQYLDQLGLKSNKSHNIKFNPKTWNPETKSFEASMLTISDSKKSVKVHYLSVQNGNIIKTREQCFGSEPCSVSTIQEGQDKKNIYYAESVETGLSMASINPNIHIVLANKDFRDFVGMADLIRRGSRVIFVSSGREKESIKEAVHSLSQKGAEVYIARTKSKDTVDKIEISKAINSATRLVSKDIGRSR